MINICSVLRSGTIFDTLAVVISKFSHSAYNLSLNMLSGTNKKNPMCDLKQVLCSEIFVTVSGADCCVATEYI